MKNRRIYIYTHVILKSRGLLPFVETTWHHSSQSFPRRNSHAWRLLLCRFADLSVKRNGKLSRRRRFGSGLIFSTPLPHASPGVGRKYCFNNTTGTQSVQRENSDDIRCSGNHTILHTILHVFSYTQQRINTCRYDFGISHTIYTIIAPVS